MASSSQSIVSAQSKIWQYGGRFGPRKTQRKVLCSGKTYYFNHYLNTLCIFVLRTFVDHILDSQHANIIRKHFTFLVQNLDMKFSDLINEFYRDNVIEYVEKKELESIEVSVSRNERFLSILSQKSSETFQKFLSVLNRTEQHHIAVTIQPGISYKIKQYNQCGSTRILPAHSCV